MPEALAMQMMESPGKLKGVTSVDFKKRALIACFLCGSFLVGCEAPADPVALNCPAYRPLINGRLVTIEVINANGAKTEGKSLQKAINGFGKYVAGEVRTIVAEPIEIKADENGFITTDIIDAVAQKRRYRGPCDITIYIVPDISDFSHRGYCRLDTSGRNVSHYIVIQAPNVTEGSPAVVAPEQWWHLVIKHELCHALDVPLVRDHAWSNRHCTHPECILYPRPDGRAIVAGILRLGPPMDLCPACRNEIYDVQQASGGKLFEPDEPYGIMDLVNEQVKLNPDNPRVYAIRSKVYGDRNEYGKATDDYIKKVELDNNLKEVPPLFMAAYEGRSKIVSTLLSSGADINARYPKENATALMAAVCKGHSDIVKILLENGADVKAKATSDRTALFMAAGLGKTEYAQMLLERGADIDALAGKGFTPLIIASLDGRVETVKLLIEKGAGINIKNNGGNTALISAADNGHKEIVEILINAGADMNFKNNIGVTALDVARKNNHEAIVNLLCKLDG